MNELKLPEILIYSLNKDGLPYEWHIIHLAYFFTPFGE